MRNIFNTVNATNSAICIIACPNKNALNIGLSGFKVARVIPASVK